MFFSSVYASLAGYIVLALNKLSRRRDGVLMKLFSPMKLTSVESKLKKGKTSFGTSRH